MAPKIARAPAKRLGTQRNLRKRFSNVREVADSAGLPDVRVDSRGPRGIHSVMREVLDGVHHWTAVHPIIDAEVSSYYVAPSRTLIDPMATDEVFEWLKANEERPD